MKHPVILKLSISPPHFGQLQVAATLPLGFNLKINILLLTGWDLVRAVVVVVGPTKTSTDLPPQLAVRRTKIKWAVKISYHLLSISDSRQIYWYRPCHKFNLENISFNFNLKETFLLPITRGQLNYKLVFFKNFPLKFNL